MKKLLISSIICCMTLSLFGQGASHSQILFLAKTYHNFMFRNEPTKDVMVELRGISDPALVSSADFIAQTITSKNKILTTPYLKRPDNQTLKQLYIIRAVNLNLSEKEPLDNDHLIDSLQNAEIPVYELVDNYYGLLFTAVGNKKQPFNLSKVNFKMNEYDLKDDTEKAIFFFNCMSLCGINIWGFINIAKPMNTKKAYEYIKKFPKFNGRPYYEYQDFFFKDFEMEIVKSNGVESYKSYYLNKYYETLLYHLLCLNVEGASQKEIDDLMLGSILKERSLYPYTKYKETLEGLFKEVKK